MNSIARTLENWGQEPKTFVRDAVLFLVRYFVVLFLALLPMAIVSTRLIPTKAATALKALPFNQALLFIIPPLVIYLFFAINFVVACTGGWHRLSRKFRAPKHFKEGTYFRFQSANVGFGSYNNVLAVRVSPQGLYLAPQLPVMFMHPPLLIPWHEISAARQAKIFSRPTLLLTVGHPKLATVGIPESKLAKAILPHVEPVLKTSDSLS